MSTINDRILKSLASLEQNLNEINSAKEQVSLIINSSSELAKVIGSYQESFASLSQNVESILEDSREFNYDSVSKLSLHAESLSIEIKKLSEFDVSESIKSIDSEVVKHFHKNLIQPIEKLNEQSNKIQKEITKLIEFDFHNSMDQVEKDVIHQFNLNLQAQLLIIDEKGNELQSKIDDLNSQIIRLEQFDIVSHLNSATEKLINELKTQNAILILRLNSQDATISIVKWLICIVVGMSAFNLLIAAFM